MSDSCENSILQRTVCSLYQIIFFLNASSIKIDKLYVHSDLPAGNTLDVGCTFSFCSLPQFLYSLIPGGVDGCSCLLRPYPY